MEWTKFKLLIIQIFNIFRQLLTCDIYDMKITVGAVKALYSWNDTDPDPWTMFVNITHNNNVVHSIVCGILDSAYLFSQYSRKRIF